MVLKDERKYWKSLRSRAKPTCAHVCVHVRERGVEGESACVHALEGEAHLVSTYVFT